MNTLLSEYAGRSLGLDEAHSLLSELRGVSLLHNDQPAELLLVPVGKAISFVLTTLDGSLLGASSRFPDGLQVE